MDFTPRVELVLCVSAGCCGDFIWTGVFQTGRFPTDAFVPRYRSDEWGGAMGNELVAKWTAEVCLSSIGLCHFSPGHFLIERIDPDPLLVDLHRAHVARQVDPRRFIIEPGFDQVILVVT